MKNSQLSRTGRQILAFSVMLFCSVLVFGQPVKKEILSGIPAEVSTVLTKACTTCHSNEGKDKPKAAVNFSIWDQYTSSEKKLLAGSIQAEVQKGGMPPKRYLESHPESALTEAEIKQITQWCESLKTKP
jgi:hypothetical protein